MPIAGFICPDEQKVVKEDCFNKCRMGRRCHSIAFLMEAGYSLPYFKNKLAVTQILAPFRITYLRLKTMYYIVPDNRVGLVLGSWIHKGLAAHGTKIIQGNKIAGENDSGSFDALEPDCQHKGQYVLSESKVTRAAYYDGTKGTLRDDAYKQLSLQINNYRIKCEDAGYPISRMQAELLLKDRPVEAISKTQIVDIPVLPDEYVNAYFKERAQQLLHYLTTDTIPPKCNNDESWDGKKCQFNFCEVAENCKE